MSEYMNNKIPLQKKILTAFKAGVSFLANGAPLVDNQTRQNRVDICRSCEFMKQGRCELCGCYLELKVSMATEKCPDNPPRWLDILPDQIPIIEIDPDTFNNISGSNCNCNNK